MKKKTSLPKRYTGDKKRIYEYIREHKTAKTGDIFNDLNILPKKIWELTNELEAEGVISTIV